MTIQFRMTILQIRVIFYLEAHPGSIIQEIANAFEMEHPSISRCVKLLEEKEYLVRDGHKIRLTEYGKGFALTLHWKIKSQLAYLHQKVAELEALQRDGAEEAHLAHNQKVVGSSPTPATYK